MAAVYDDGRQLLPEAEEAWRRSLEGVVEPGTTVVDIGAGTGRFARRFAGQLGADVVAVEPAGAMRSVGAASRTDGVRWVGGRAEQLPLAPESVDVAWMACVVHYVDLERVGAELARVVRPGGSVLVRHIFPDRFDELEWLRWFPEARVVDEARMPAFEHLVATWAAAGLRLRERRRDDQLVANDLTELAARLGHRAISTLELISDESFERGMATLRSAARTAKPAPVVGPVDLVLFDRP